MSTARNPIVQTSDDFVQRALAANSNGEIKGYGVPWACAAYGDEGHDYLACRACFANFQRHIAAWGTA